MAAGEHKLAAELKGATDSKKITNVLFMQLILLSLSVVFVGG